MKKNRLHASKLFPIKKILCPTDLSEPSYTGISAAAEIAENQSAELIIIHVVTPVYHGGSSLVPSGFDAKEYYKELREIAKTSEEEKVDLIVIATHGWTGWRRFIFGSVAEKVVRLSTQPVLTIPEP